MKPCSRCKQTKDNSEFYTRKEARDGLESACKDCRKQERAQPYRRKLASRATMRWTKRNWKKVKANIKLWRIKNKEHLFAYRKRHLKEVPWYTYLFHARERCNNPNKDGYKYYGGKGIKCFLTGEEVKTLWFRDKAWLLKQPSIDRIKSSGHYEFSNCRFIELIDNISRKYND